MFNVSAAETNQLCFTLSFSGIPLYTIKINITLTDQPANTEKISRTNTCFSFISPRCTGPSRGLMTLQNSKQLNGNSIDPSSLEADNDINDDDDSADSTLTKRFYQRNVLFYETGTATS